MAYELVGINIHCPAGGYSESNRISPQAVEEVLDGT